VGGADIADSWAGGADIVDSQAGGTDIVDVGPIQMPVFPYWIHIGTGANDTDNLSI